MLTFDIYPHAFLEKRRGYCNHLRLSVMLSPPKPLDEIQPNLVCELLTWMRHATANFFCPAPWGPGEGLKGQISFNFNYKVNFKDFYTKLCVCPHKWMIQNISDGILILLPGSYPRGWTLGAGGAEVVKKNFFQTWSCGISNRRGWRAEQNVSKIFILGSNYWPWGEVKRSNILKFWLPCQFYFYIPNFACVLTNKR